MGWRYSAPNFPEASINARAKNTQLRFLDEEIPQVKAGYSGNLYDTVFSEILAVVNIVNIVVVVVVL